MSAPEPTWKRSSFCGTNACVEVSRIGGNVYIRNSTTPRPEPLVFTDAEWTAFLAGVWAGEFGWPEGGAA